MYESDPFAAHKAVRLRQEEAAKQKAASEAGSSNPTARSQVSKEFINAPEVKMAASLRDIVEEAIRKVCRSSSHFPEPVPITPPDVGIVYRRDHLNHKHRRTRRQSVGETAPNAGLQTGPISESRSLHLGTFAIHGELRGNPNASRRQYSVPLTSHSGSRPPGEVHAHKQLVKPFHH